jgi:hypothetical protein
MPNRLRHSQWTILAILPVCLGWTVLVAAEKNSAYRVALESITADDLGRNVQYLADDKLEGREAGSPGGRAAGDWLAGQFASLHLRPSGTGGAFLQPFPPSDRNVLGMVPGGDPQLKDYVVVVGAHYDHVGRRQKDGKVEIYPGADDNASGTSAVLELARALTLLAAPPKRSVLLACWDGEEKGMLGSKHWLAHPTVPLDHVVTVVNVDMIGYLRSDRLMVLGWRTGCGFRRLLSEQNCGPDGGNLLLEFPWTLTANADHFAFYERGLPVFMLHTGMHENYHKPSDEARRINREGMQRVTRLLFAAVYELANQPKVSGFRSTAGSENEDARKRLTEPEALSIQPGDKPLRLGLAWRVDPAEPGTIVLSHVVAGSPAAAAGLRVGDRIYRIGGRDFVDDAAFASLARALPGPIELLVERDGQLRVFVLHLAGEAGAAKRAA